MQNLVFVYVVIANWTLHASLTHTTVYVVYKYMGGKVMFIQQTLTGLCIPLVWSHSKQSEKSTWFVSMHQKQLHQLLWMNQLQFVFDFALISLKFWSNLSIKCLAFSTINIQRVLHHLKLFWHSRQDDDITLKAVCVQCTCVCTEHAAAVRSCRGC